MTEHTLRQQVIQKLQSLIAALHDLESQPSFRFSANAGSRVPKRAGVYVIWRDNNAVYVGESSNLRTRLLVRHRTGRNSALWDKLREEDTSRADSDIQDILLERCSFRFFSLGVGERYAYETRRRFEAFLQAYYNPKLNFLPVREQRKRLKQLREEMASAWERDDWPTTVRLAEELKRIKREFVE